MADWFVFLCGGVICTSTALQWFSDLLKSETVWGKVFNALAISGAGLVAFRLFGMI